jgi:hypothetical protein
MVGHQNPVNSAGAKFAVKLVLRRNSGLGLPERLPTVSEQAVGSSQDLVDRGAGEIIKIPGQYCRFGKTLAQVPKHVGAIFPGHDGDMIKMGIGEIKPLVPVGLTKQAESDHAGESTAPVLTAMHLGSFGQPDVVPFPWNNRLGPIKNSGILAGGIDPPMLYKRFVTSQVCGQILHLGDGDLLTGHQIWGICPKNFEHQFFTVPPFVGTVHGVEEADVKGHEAHTDSETPALENGFSALHPARLVPKLRLGTRAPL